MTGFHGFHVTMGVICMIFVTVKAFAGKYTATDHRGVEVIGLYWHFVDLVWIILFTIVYLI
jgi:heme/copper-type cytochrome/quinol oxidase subunit 3